MKNPFPAMFQKRIYMTVDAVQLTILLSAVMATDTL